MKTFRSLMMMLLLGMGCLWAAPGFAQGSGPSDGVVSKSGGSELSQPGVIPQQITAGEPVPFSIHYTSPSNDVPIHAFVEEFPPGVNDPIKIDLQVVESAAGNGKLLQAVYTPTENGVYHYRYRVIDANGPIVYPPDGSPEDYRVQPRWMPWLITGLGAIVCLVIIAALVYQIVHRLFGAAQISSARAAIMIGILCWFVCILYAWGLLNNVIALGAAGVIAVLFLVWALIAR